MQVASTLNNSIRILFNPRVESFKLFDFLIVKSDEDRYIAQIIEIYDDKFDASQNVAKLKLFYKIAHNNEVMPYDNFTPNKECEIIKIKQEEIETFINQDKKTFIFATNTKSSTSLNIQYEFFDSAVVLADKIENANAISYNLAKNLSGEKNVVIIDSTGVLDYEGIKKIKASKNFRLPLNYNTLDYVFNRCLSDASLEFQATGGQIINEIKKFAKQQEHGFIPFNLFTKVILEQYKVTPYPELKLLLTRLKKYQMEDVFARNKNEKNILFETIQKNPITILDLSTVDTVWQKAYFEHFVSEIEQDIYLITRINDDGFDVDLINKIYNKKKNIKFIPNVSYNYKKLPSVMQHCKNYILMPSLYQRADFLDANFALSNLITDGCLIFGKNTDNFIYLACDYELTIQEKRKNYRKIALTMAQNDQEVEQKLGEKGDYFENKQKEMSDSQRLIQELSEFESQRQEELNQQEEPSKVQEETFEEIENPTTAPIEEEAIAQETTQTEEDLIFNNEANEINVKNESQDEFQELNEKINEEIHEAISEDVAIQTEENSKTEEKEAENVDPQDQPYYTAPPQEDLYIDVLDETEVKIEEEKEEVKIETEEITPPKNDTIDLLPMEEEQSDDESLDLSDDELDFFQMAQDSEKELENNNNNNDNDDEIDLSELAQNSINESFDDIVNTKKEPSAQTISVDKNVEIDEKILNNQQTKENLPIFKEENKVEINTKKYSVGNVIIHKKYGRGTVIKTIKYEERQLLQIEFEEAGKKLLDPTVADIKLEQ